MCAVLSDARKMCCIVCDVVCDVVTCAACCVLDTWIYVQICWGILGHSCRQSTGMYAYGDIKTCDGRNTRI